MIDRPHETQNKGINVTGSTFPLQENTSESQNTEFPSLHEMRHQLQNVINVMDTSTPHFVYTNTASGDADEESIISSTSIISSVLQFKHLNKAREQSGTTMNAVRDISEASNAHEVDTYNEVNDLPHDNPPKPLCIPAVLPPAVLCMNPSCVCTHSYGYMQQTPVQYHLHHDHNWVICRVAGSELGDRVEWPQDQLIYQSIKQEIRPCKSIDIPICRRLSKSISADEGAASSYRRETLLFAAQEQFHRNNKQSSKEKKHTFSKFIGKLKRHSREMLESESPPMELYKMNIMQTANEDGSPPRRFVFDLIDEVPKPDTNTIGTNTRHQACNNKGTCTKSQKGLNKMNYVNRGINTQRNSWQNKTTITHNNPNKTDKFQTTTYYKNMKENNRPRAGFHDDTAKIDVYYFDHGNAAYYRTTDSAPVIFTELLAEKTENYATKFWAELFGAVYIGAAFITSFILQFLRFLLYSIIRPLTVGILQLASDYFFKPFLAVLFNALIQPPLIFLYNIATTIRDLCKPLAEGVGYFLREIGVLFKSIRLFEIKQEKHISENTCTGKCQHEAKPRENCECS